MKTPKARRHWAELVAASAVTAGFGALGVLRGGPAGRRRARRVSHASQTEAEYRRARNRVLILGAGFGGRTAALELDGRLGGRGVSVLVVDRDNSSLFTPLLWTVADGRSDPNDAVVPIRKFQRKGSFHALQAEVLRIDLDRREVATSAGPRPYGRLVVALGSETAVPGLPGLRERALLFRTPADAMQLRTRLIDAVEAAHNSADPDERKACLTFVVGGGGDTGVELAGVIHEYVNTALFVEYPWLAGEGVRIVVVERNDRLVPKEEARVSDAVRRVLEAERVEVMTGASLEGVTDGAVRTSKGTIPARTVFWAAGIRAPGMLKGLPVEHGPNGSVRVDEYLRVPAYPEVYVVGDAAWASESVARGGLPPTAQAAEHAGRYVGGAIADDLLGREVWPFRFRPLGHLSLLDKRAGVAEVGPFVFAGLPAWLIWHGYYLSHIPSWRNRLRLLSDWLVAALAGRDTAQLRLEAATAVTRRTPPGAPAGGRPARQDGNAVAAPEDAGADVEANADGGEPQGRGGEKAPRGR